MSDFGHLVHSTYIIILNAYLLDFIDCIVTLEYIEGNSYQINNIRSKGADSNLTILHV